MKILAIIPARGGSKGLPRKNIKLLAGKPLIAWSIETASKAKGIDRIIVSTDDKEIADIALKYGAEVPFLRPPEFARDESPQYETVMHAIEWLRNNDSYIPDYILLLQPTSPMRSFIDIENSIEILNEKKPVAVVGVTEAKNHPYLTKTINEYGILENYSKDQSVKYFRRQDMPKVFAINGAIYLEEVKHFEQHRNFIPEGTVPYIMPAIRSIDVDSELDFKIAAALLQGIESEK